jgi:hypothetical protein
MRPNPFFGKGWCVEHAILCRTQASRQVAIIMNPRNKPMDLPKKPGKVIEFSPSQEADAPSPDAITRIEVFVARLVESNELLTVALERLRDFHLAGGSPLLRDKVLAEVEVAIETASRVKNGF